MTDHTRADGFTQTIKDSQPRRGMQVKLEGGPFHGETTTWDPSQSRYIYRALMGPMYAGLDSASDSLSAVAYTLPVRKVVYELDRWNEAGTAGIAKCVDDGKPKCKEPFSHARMGQAFRDTRNRLRAENYNMFEVAITKTCPACFQPEGFEVKPNKRT